MSNITSTIKFSRNIKGINDVTVESIKDRVNQNISTKLDAYLESIRKHKPQAEITLASSIFKTKTNQFVSNFVRNIDGKVYNFAVDTDTPYDDLYQMIDREFAAIKDKFSREFKK